MLAHRAHRLPFGPPGNGRAGRIVREEQQQIRIPSHDGFDAHGGGWLWQVVENVFPASERNQLGKKTPGADDHRWIVPYDHGNAAAVGMGDAAQAVEGGLETAGDRVHPDTVAQDGREQPRRVRDIGQAVHLHVHRRNPQPGELLHRRPVGRGRVHHDQVRLAGGHCLDIGIQAVAHTGDAQRFGRVIAPAGPADHALAVPEGKEQLGAGGSERNDSPGRARHRYRKPKIVHDGGAT